jgi:hypothetical protein
LIEKDDTAVQDNVPDFIKLSANDGALTINPDNNDQAGTYTILITAVLDNLYQLAPQLLSDTTQPETLYDPKNPPNDLIYTSEFLIKVTIVSNSEDAETEEFVQIANIAPYLLPKPVDI